jgi:hypothetical protein
MITNEEKIAQAENTKRLELSAAFKDEFLIFNMKNFPNPGRYIEQEKYRRLHNAIRAEAQIRSTLHAQNDAFIKGGGAKGNKLVIRADKKTQELLRIQIAELTKAIALAEKELRTSKLPILVNQRDKLVRALTAAEIELKLEEIELYL